MYAVRFTPQAEADLSRLDRDVAQRILRKLRWLAENFELLTPEPLSGTWHGVFKLRVGDYRVLYTCTGETIIVHRIAHRREVYKAR